MVKLVRVERTCEQTGHPACPLAPCQRPESTPLYSATSISIAYRPASPNTPVMPLDSAFKPRKRILFVVSPNR
jgi:hypothetical protein